MAVKWLMKDSKETLSYGLMYDIFKGLRDGLQEYVDVDYTGDLDKRISLTGYLFMVNGCLINWKANL